MLFQPQNTKFEYKFHRPKHIHKHNCTYILHSDTSIYIFKSSIILTAINNITCYVAKGRNVFFVKDQLHHYDIELNEEKCYDFYFKQITCNDKYVIGYTKYKCYVIDINKNSFISKSIIIEQLKVNDYSIYVSNGDICYIYDFQLNISSILECEFCDFYVNNSYVIFLGSEIQFYKIDGTKLKVYENALTEYFNFQITESSFACQNNKSVVLFDIKKDELKQVWEVEHACGDFVLGNEMYLIDEKYVIEYELNNFKNKILLANFESVYVMNNLYFGKMEDKVIFYDIKGNYIDTMEFDSDKLDIKVINEYIYIILREVNVDKVKKKLYIINDDIILKTKIMIFDNIVNIESEYIICVIDEKYCVYRHDTSITELNLSVKAKKILITGEETEVLLDNDTIGDLSEVIDFYIFPSLRFFIKKNGVTIYKDNELIGDINIDYINYLQYKNSIVFLTEDELIVVNDSVEHYSCKLDQIYASNEYFVGVIDKRFCFNKNIMEIDAFKTVLNEFKERDIKIAELTENVDSLAIKAEAYEKTTRETKDKIKKWWFF